MNKTKFFGKSVSVMVVVIIAITAFTKDPLRLYLLISTFTVWFICLVGVWFRSSGKNGKGRTKNQRRVKNITGELVEPVYEDMRHLILCHVNHRITAYFSPKYPNFMWKWVTENPEEIAINGGVGRIQIFGVEGYPYAEITLDAQGHMKCALLRIVSLEENASTFTETETWFATYGKHKLLKLLGDLDSRGYGEAEISEDGKVFAQLLSGNVKHEILTNFPDRRHWPTLIKLISDEGYDVTETDNGLLLSWCSERNTA